MFSHVTQQPLTERGALTRRGSKLLVEMIIGVIGILGIMLSQVEMSQAGSVERTVVNGNIVVSLGVARAATKPDWAEILF